VDAKKQSVRLLEPMEKGPGVTPTEVLIDPATGGGLMKADPRFWAEHFTVR
jgi:hypothetical protein